MFFAVRSIGVLPMAQPTNSAEPTGGVHRPTARLKIITTPKCTGSTPSGVTTGNRIGVMIVISGAMSIKQPSTSRSALMMSSRIYRLSVMESSAAEMAAGMRSSVIMYANALAVASSVMTIASVFRLLRMMPGMSVIFTVRKTTMDRSIVYTHAMAEDSVAVNTPAPVPTMMMTSVIMGRMPSSSTFSRAPLGTPTPLGKL